MHRHARIREDTHTSDGDRRNGSNDVKTWAEGTTKTKTKTREQTEFKQRLEGVITFNVKWHLVSRCGQKRSTKVLVRKQVGLKKDVFEKKTKPQHCHHQADSPLRLDGKLLFYCCFCGGGGGCL